MTSKQNECIRRAIAALTYEEVIVCDVDVTEVMPILDRSISLDLDDIERNLGARGKTRLHAIGQSIDEALLCLQEYFMEGQ